MTGPTAHLVRHEGTDPDRRPGKDDGAGQGTPALRCLSHWRAQKTKSEGYRPLVGIARERETRVDDAAPYQCECRPRSQPRIAWRVPAPSLSRDTNSCALGRHELLRTGGSR